MLCGLDGRAVQAWAGLVCVVAAQACNPPACSWCFSFCLPAEDAIAARRRELSMYGDAPPGSSSAARGGLLLTILDSYSSRFRCGGALLVPHNI